MALSSHDSASESEPFLEVELEKQSTRRAPTRSILRSLLLLVLSVLRPIRSIRPNRSQLAILLPSFVRRNASIEHLNTSTAWLDGLRGWASFFVYIRHFASATHPDIQVGYGRDENNEWLIQLPFFRLTIGGPAMVSLFFIISGYALTWGPLKALHTKNGGGAEGALLRLSSATFRRAARLFGPAIVSTFLVMLFITLGFYDRGHASMNAHDMPGFQEPEPPQYRLDPFSVQLTSWIWETWGFLKVWTPGGHSYDVHLWTLPVEFRCSIILFVSLVGFVRCRVWIRAVGLFGLVIYCHWTDYWQGWLFFAGGFLAQLRFIQMDGEAASSSSFSLLPASGDAESASMSDSKRARRIHYPDILRLTLFSTGLYLLSAPDYGHASQAPGYIWLAENLTPPHWPENWRVLHCYGGFLVVYATSSTSTNVLRWLFSNPLSRYLGDISYALYLVHGPIVHMLGFWLVPWMWDHVIGRDVTLGGEGGSVVGWQESNWWGMGMWGKELGFMYAFIVVTVVVVWAADLFWRGVDRQCVRLAKWIEGLCLEKKS